MSTKPKTIFPPHVPGIIHPNVNSMATLIDDLDGDSETLETTLSSSSAQCDTIKGIGKKCEPFLHRSNLYSLQLERIKADKVTYHDQSKYTKGKITELTALSKLHSLNYKYCIASQSCPKRMDVLNRCYMSFKSDAIKDFFQAGRHDLICNKEKVAVERCVGKLIMEATRDIC